MRGIVEDEFDLWVEQKFAPKPQIVKFFKNHERKQICIDGLCEQVEKAQSSNIGRRMDRDRLKMFVGAGAEVFCKLALEFEAQRHMSGAEKQRRIDVHEAVKAAEDMIVAEHTEVEEL